MDYRFRVHEYLKGSGANEISASVSSGFHDTEALAQADIPALRANHDTRWDNRQAIVFLYEEPTGDKYLGGKDRYQVSSLYFRSWLPEAQETSSRSLSSGSDPSFILALSGTTAGGALRSASVSNGDSIRLSALKTRISEVEAEANVGGTDEYRACVERAYRYHRKHAALEEAGQLRSTINYGPIKSGMPEALVYHRVEYGWTYENTSESSIGRHWFEGPDADVVKYKVTDWSRSRSGRFSGKSTYVGQIVTARPLPADTYVFFYNRYVPAQLVCNKFSPLETNRHTLRLTAVSPPRTLHEAFFDPVDIATAVGADGANGVLEPNAFSLDGATTTISSLKWQDGAVTMTLSPTASLADYAIDFIDVTGATTLSLTSDNASTTALTWTVPDKPWSDGDLLILRIHKPISNDATLSGLALSGVDLTFDPATTTYAASVPATTTQTTVTPTTNHDSATYVVKLGGVVDADGTIPLAAGDNVITIEVTAEDATTTKTYTVTVTRAAPQAPVTVTLAPRPQGSATRVNITIEWNDPQTCDGEYLVALYTSSDYMVQFLGYTPASETPSRTTESATNWDLSRFPDWFAGVTCYPNASSDPARDLGRVSLRAAHPDSN